MKHLIHRFAPKHLTQRQVTKKAFTKLADSLGFVYFGNVDQFGDDHAPVRGLTQSARHRDRHYTVGSIDGYDVAYVERQDSVKHPGKRTAHHMWTILSIDLNSTVDLPHLFIGLKSHNETFRAMFATKFSRMQDASYLFVPEDSRYSVYVTPTDLEYARTLFSDDVLQKILQHFGHLTIEISNNSLYIYSENQRTTKSLLDTMLQNGLWLASIISNKSEIK